MKKIDLSNVKEAGESRRLPAGAYICKITDVQDIAGKEYLKVTYDIAAGEYAGHYDEIRAEHPDWAWIGAYSRSYKPKALSMFKRFCTAINKSNGAYIFDCGAINADERTLIGKKIGLLLQEEEYYTNSGDLSTRLIVNKEFPIDQLDAQEVPPIKKLKENASAPAAGVNTGFIDVSDGDADEVPFG